MTAIGNAQQLQQLFGQHHCTLIRIAANCSAGCIIAIQQPTAHMPTAVMIRIAITCITSIIAVVTGIVLTAGD